MILLADTNILIDLGFVGGLPIYCFCWFLS